MKNNYKDLINCALSFIETLKIEHPLICDHICYRVTTNEDYLELKNQLSQQEEFVHEAVVRGRAISIFKFKEPIKFMGLSISSLELPAPKVNNTYTEGYEHLEFVIQDLNNFISMNPHINFDISGMNRELNPELAVSISNDYQIKFHPIDILEVISIERSLNIYEVK